MIANIHTIQSDDGTGGVSDRKRPDVGNRSAIIPTMATDPNMSTRLNRIMTTFLVVNKAQRYDVAEQTQMAYDRLWMCKTHFTGFNWMDVHCCPDCDKPMICDLQHDDPCTCRTYECECSECQSECDHEYEMELADSPDPYVTQWVAVCIHCEHVADPNDVDGCDE